MQIAVSTSQVLALALSLLCAPVSAETRAPLWYVGAQASHVQPDGARDAKNAAGGTLFVGKPLGRDFNAEANVFGHAFHARDDGDDAPAYGAGLDLSYVPSWTGGRVFALLGGGAVHERFTVPDTLDDQGVPVPGESDDSVSPFARAGIGFYVPGFTRSFNVIPAYYRNRWLLRADISWYGVFNDRINADERLLGDVRLNIGLVFARTPPRPGDPPPTPPPEPQVVPIEPATAGE